VVSKQLFSCEARRVRPLFLPVIGGCPASALTRAGGKRKCSSTSSRARLWKNNNPHVTINPQLTMASKADEGSKVPRERISAKSTADPILRNALRYTISAKEYETLHKYIISRSKVLKRNAPSPAKVEKLVERPGRDDYNAAAIRDSLRVFLATAAGLKAWAVIKEQFLGGEHIRYTFLPSD
jgi:hypothetical protein